MILKPPYHPVDRLCDEFNVSSYNAARGAAYLLEPGFPEPDADPDYLFEKARADAEKARADGEKARADDERQRRERLEAKLRALGIDPEAEPT